MINILYDWLKVCFFVFFCFFVFLNHIINNLEDPLRGS